jgi:hypothetical protein
MEPLSAQDEEDDDQVQEMPDGADGTYLQQTDGRSAQALEKRFNTELGEFRLW